MMDKFTDQLESDIAKTLLSLSTYVREIEISRITTLEGSDVSNFEASDIQVYADQHPLRPPCAWGLESSTLIARALSSHSIHLQQCLRSVMALVMRQCCNLWRGL